MFDTIQEITRKHIAAIIKKEDEIFESSVRNNATPKVKGEITFGKLKWRGIIIASDLKGNSWLEQRGKRISPIIQRTITVLV